MKKVMKLSSAFVALGILILFFFQNCAKVKFSAVPQVVEMGSECTCTSSEIDSMQITSSVNLANLTPGQMSTYSVSAIPACLGEVNFNWNSGAGPASNLDYINVAYGVGAHTLRVNVKNPETGCGANLQLEINLNWLQCDPASGTVYNPAACPLTPSGTTHCRSKQTCQANGMYGLCQYEAITSGYVISGTACVQQTCNCGSKMINGSCQSDGVSRSYPSYIDPATRKVMEKVCACSAPSAANPPWVQTSIDDYARTCYERWNGNCDTANRYYPVGAVCKKIEWVSTGQCSVSGCGQVGTIIHQCKMDGALVADGECTNRGIARPNISCETQACAPTCPSGTHPEMVEWPYPAGLCDAIPPGSGCAVCAPNCRSDMYNKWNDFTCRCPEVRDGPGGPGNVQLVDNGQQCVCPNGSAPTVSGYGISWCN